METIYQPPPGPPEPAPPRRRRALGQVAFLAIGVPLLVEMGVLLLPGASGGLPGLATWELAVAAFTQNGLALAAILFFLREEGHDLSVLGFRRGRAAEEILLGVALGGPLLLGSALLLLVLIHLFPALHDVAVNPLLAKIQGVDDLVIMLATVVVAAGMGEELVRAFVLRRFASDLGGMALGLVVWSAIFGLMHLPQGTDKAILVGFVGLSLGLVYAWRGNPLAAMAAHATFNAAQTILAYWLPPSA